MVEKRHFRRHIHSISGEVQLFQCTGFGGTNVRNVHGLMAQRCDALLILQQTLRISYATDFNKEAHHSELICKLYSSVMSTLLWI